MGNGRLGEFSEAAKAPAVLSLVLETWWKVASTPGDLVEVLVATATAGLLEGARGSRRTAESNAVSPCLRNL